MVNYILPRDPNNNQLEELKKQLAKIINLNGELALLSISMFEELRNLNPDSQLLTKWRWVINGLL